MGRGGAADECMSGNDCAEMAPRPENRSPFDFAQGRPLGAVLHWSGDQFNGVAVISQLLSHYDKLELER